MLMKCQNKQLVLNLTAKGTAGESSLRHHLAHTQSLDKTLGTVVGVYLLLARPPRSTDLLDPIGPGRPGGIGGNICVYSGTRSPKSRSRGRDGSRGLPTPLDQEGRGRGLGDPKRNG